MTGLRPEGCGIALRAMIIKSALRDLLLCHYGYPVISSGGTSRYESHSFVETVKGSWEISLQKATFRQEGALGIEATAVSF